MKIKHPALSGLFIFCHIFASVLICMVVESMLLVAIDKFIYISYPVQTVIRIVIYTAGTLGLLTFLSYHEGYREAAFSPADTIGGTLLAAIIQLLLSLLFHFQGFIAGGVRFTAGLIYHSRDITHELLAETPTYVFLAIFALYTVVYAAALTVGKYLGARKRLTDRAELTKWKNDMAETNE